MNFSFNAYSLVLLFFGVLNTVLAVHIFKRGNAMVRWFAMVMVFSSIWSIGYSFELASETLEQSYFFVILEYIGIAFLPFFWLLFALDFNNRKGWYRKRHNLIFLLIIPILNFLIVLTNQKHHWYFSEVTLVQDSTFPMLTYQYGIVYYLFSVYAYAMILLGYYHFIQKLKRSDNNFRVQYTIITLFALVPWCGDVLYKMGFRMNGHIEVTPYLFVFTSIAIFIGVYRYKLFDIVPMARAKILELMEDGFVLLDQKLKVIDHNKALTRFIGNPNVKTLIGQHAKDLFCAYPQLLNGLKNGVQSITLKAVFDHAEHDFKATITTLNDNSLNNNSTIIKFQDLTHKQREALKTKEQAKELEELNTLKDQIFSAIALDLRGPIINISEVFKLISDKRVNNEEFKALAPTLSKEIIQTTEMLENLLHWSRSQLKGFGIKKEFFDVRSILINEINYYQPIAQLKKIQIINDVFPKEIVYGDIILFQIVVRNILNNAIKFSHEGGTIELNAAYQKNKMIRICIIDNGIGIAKDRLSKLLSLNNQHTTRGTKNEKGTGLGLIICHEFMKKNGGYITAESELGKGSNFCLWLPTLENSN